MKINTEIEFLIKSLEEENNVAPPLVVDKVLNEKVEVNDKLTLLLAQELYGVVVAEFEKIINNFSYKCFELDICEKVYLIEDIFVIYVGLIDFHENTSYFEPSYRVVFEELSHNTLFDPKALDP